LSNTIEIWVAQSVGGTVGLAVTNGTETTRPMLNSRQIEAFRWVIIMGGVSSAAQTMNITQPAVTRLLQDFQHAVGLKLFTKRGTRLVPTNDALSLYREVERQFVGLERIESAAKRLREGQSGRLRIASLPTFNVGFLPRIVGRFTKDKPGLEVAMYGSVSLQVVDWVASGFCDVGFAEGPLDFPNIDVEFLAPVRCVAVLPEGHRLTDKPVLEPEDFSDERFVSLEPTAQMRFRIDATFATARVKRQMYVETPLSMIACGLVAAGAGVTITNPFTAFEYIGHGVVVRPFRPEIFYDVAVVWAAGRIRSTLALDVVEEVRAAVRDQANTSIGS
jgi:DNA-binding transcriptional LysR family regulator